MTTAHATAPAALKPSTPAPPATPPAPGAKATIETPVAGAKPLEVPAGGKAGAEAPPAPPVPGASAPEIVKCPIVLFPIDFFRTGKGECRVLDAESISTAEAKKKVQSGDFLKKALTEAGVTEALIVVIEPKLKFTIRPVTTFIAE
jgi:hypothetical protein